MRRRRFIAAAMTAGAAAGLAALPAAATADQHGGRAVFVQSNDPAGNAIIAFRRSATGALTRVGEFPTGGLGGTQVGAPTDPLASQGGLALDRQRHLLFAVNAGSDTVTVFKVEGTRLERSAVLPSGGAFPTSVAVGHGRAYVVNAGKDGTVSGYRIVGQRVEPIAGSTRSLGLSNGAVPFFLTSPGQIGLSPDGGELFVTTKTATLVEAFAVSGSGQLAAAPTSTATGPVPFAFVFDARGRMVLTDASGAANTFDVAGDGALVAHGASVSNGQIAQCWVVKARGFVYSTNTGSNTITGYAETHAGQLSLLSADGVSLRTGGGPIDLDATPDGRFIYELNALDGTIGVVRVGRDGALRQVGTVGGLHPFDGADGPQGIVVA